MGSKKSANEARAELAAHLAELLIGQKKIIPAGPEPEELNRQAQVERAWRELPRGHNWPAPKTRIAMFKNPILKVIITKHIVRDRGDGEVWAMPGDVLVNRIQEVMEMEGVKSVDEEGQRV